MEEQNIILFVLANKEIPGIVISKKGNGSLVIDPLISRIPLQDGKFAEKFFAPATYSDMNNIMEGVFVTFIWNKPGERGIDPITQKPADPIATSIRVVSKEDAWKLVDEITLLVSKKEREDWLEQQNLHRQELETQRTTIEQENQVRQDFLIAKSEQLEQERQKINLDRNSLAEKRQELVEIKREINCYTAILPLIENSNQAKNILPSSIPKTIDVGFDYLINLEEPEDLGDRWHTILASKDLILPESIATSYLIAMISALYSGSIILLNGTVGIGKSSIIKKSAEALGGKAEIIPVRTSWLDPSDLLGFFDPIAETFRPSTFTTALKNANNFSDRPFLICLDELNLSRIENYGADLLSTLEYSKSQSKEDDEKRTLSLYSRDIETDLWQKLELLSKLDHPNIEQQLLIVKLRHILSHVRSECEIPQNLVLIGTLNSDETTYDLSPKVIDRAYVITYPPANLRLESKNIPGGEIFGEQLSVRNLQTKVQYCIEQIKKSDELGDTWREDWEQIIKWNEQYVTELGIPIGYRVRREYQIFFAVSHCLGIRNENHCLAYFIFTKLLPRLSFFKNGKCETLCQQWIDEIREDYSMGGENYVLVQIEKQILDSGRRNVRYWG